MKKIILVSIAIIALVLIISVSGYNFLLSTIQIPVIDFSIATIWSFAIGFSGGFFGVKYINKILNSDRDNDYLSNPNS